MRNSFLLVAVAVIFTAANLNAQIDNTVVQIDFDSSVTIPAGDVIIATFYPMNSADPMGPFPA